MAQQTLSATAIARMAGVGRAAVSNWRRRYSSFPKPVDGTSANPLFEEAAVIQWLKSNSKLATEAPIDQLWRAVENCQPATRIVDALCVAGAALYYRVSQHTDQAHSTPPSPAALIEAAACQYPDLQRVLTQVFPHTWNANQQHLVKTALTIEIEPVQAFAGVIDRMATIRSAAGLAYTPEPVGQLILDLAGHPQSILDPNCGLGSLIRIASERSVQQQSLLHCYVQDINPAATAITALTWALRFADRTDVASQATITIGHPQLLLEDAFPRTAVDAVVCYPPFGRHDWGHEELSYDSRWAFGMPPRTEPELAWVQHAVSHLTTNGRAIILMPPSVAARTAGKRIRAELVRQGALRAVFAIPRGLISTIPVGLHLWVLTRPTAAPNQRILFGETTGHPADNANGRPTTDDADTIRRQITSAWQEFLQDPEGFRDNDQFRSVGAIGALDEDVDLTPSRYLAAGATDPRQILDLYTDLVHGLKAIAAGLPNLRIAGPSALKAATTVEIGDLARSGKLSVQRSSARSRDADVVTMQAVTAQDVLETSGPTGYVDLLLSSDPKATTIQAGDVLVPLLGQPVIARVATTEQIGAQLAPSICAIRVELDFLDPWFVAGALTSSNSIKLAKRQASITTGLRIDVKRLRLPVIEIEVQRTYARVFADLANLDTGLRRAAQQTGGLVAHLLAAITAGDIEPPS